MRFLLDENIHAKLEPALQQWQHGVVWAKKGSIDQIVARQAKKQKSILVTHDNDFLNANLYSPDSNWAIIVIRISPAQIAKIKSVLKESLTDMPEEVIKGRTWLLLETGLIEARKESL